MTKKTTAKKTQKDTVKTATKTATEIAADVRAKEEKKRSKALAEVEKLVDKAHEIASENHIPFTAAVGIMIYVFGKSSQLETQFAGQLIVFAERKGISPMSLLALVAIRLPEVERMMSENPCTEDHKPKK